jgi:GNAT superfamily N-acetyltransferase
VVGYVYADTAPAMETLSTYELPRIFIHQIGVAPAFQGRGVGKALIQAVSAFADTSIALPDQRGNRLE